MQLFIHFRELRTRLAPQLNLFNMLSLIPTDANWIKVLSFSLVRQLNVSFLCHGSNRLCFSSVSPVHSDSNSNLLHPLQVLAQLKKSNFTLLNQTIQFNEQGDPKFGSYSIVFWNDKGVPEEVGFFHFHPSMKFYINGTKVQWFSNGEVSK